MNNQEYLIDRLKDYIHDCEEDIAYWERQRVLAEKKIALCEEAIRLSETTLNKYRELVGEALIGCEDSD